MSRVRLPTGRAVDVHEESGQVDFLGTDATVDVVDLLALAGVFMGAAYPVSRESGGSIPDNVCPECRQSPCIGHPRPPEPPDLNKSGGSDVEGK